ncbi:MAG: fasciclin domain-containing protein [Phaeodactylibacter sp.]|nr:fasciclin domain-containing protein [Phaeodactylibacter sp.]
MATGHYVKVERNGDEIKVGGAKILGTVKASNGIVHVVDAVLLPPD